ncbi:MAG: RNA polymerase factor sigma-54 [Rubrivivax sp.]|nr:RNA polymerase factor sigma-54 [Rubrivivax sp.]
MKPSLQVRLSQHLALTPQLQQSIRLLQLSTLELHQEVGQMLEQNPFLDVEEDSPAPFEAAREAAGPDPAEHAVAEGAAAGDRHDVSFDGFSEGREGTEAAGAAEGAEVAEMTEIRAEDFGKPGRDDWENGTEGDDFDGIRELPGRARESAGDDDGELGERRGADTTLAEHLRRQAIAMRLSPEDRVALLALIDSLDADGYLADPLEEIGARLLEMSAAAKGRAGKGIAGKACNGADIGVAAASGGTTEESPGDPAEAMHDRLRCALRWLQSLEPAGVGARDLGECLALQLRHLPRGPARTLALRIAQNYLEPLAKRDIRRLTALTGASEEGVRQAQALIVACEPKPGRPFSHAEANIVVPDVVVRKAGRGLAVTLNPDVMPRLRINDLYAQAARQQRGAHANPGLAARLQEARWFVKNVQQRFDTILRVSRAIVERQRAFFTHGAIAMKPLVLREIAEELGLHESTISRVTTAKYMATPQGTFELKYFFGSSLATEAGGNASSTAVRALIQRFVAAENAASPLSDSQLSQMLEEQGIQVARRTVAKYREALRIAPAAQRKAI